MGGSRGVEGRDCTWGRCAESQAPGRGWGRGQCHGALGTAGSQLPLPPHGPCPAAPEAPADVRTRLDAFIAKVTLGLEFPFLCGF